MSQYSDIRHIPLTELANQLLDIADHTSAVDSATLDDIGSSVDIGAAHKVAAPLANRVANTRASINTIMVALGELSDSYLASESDLFRSTHVHLHNNKDQ